MEKLAQVDLRQLHIPDELLQRLGEKTDELLSIEDPREKRAFVKDNTALWEEVRRYLIELSDN
jgi:hypothetical protein